MKKTIIIIASALLSLSAAVLTLVLCLQLRSSVEPEVEIPTIEPETPKEEEIEGTIGLKYTLLDDKTYEVSCGTAKGESNILIPSKYKGIAVSSLADNAFDSCEKLTQIIIPESVTRIGDAAFYNCTSLTTIEIPNLVTSIGEECFYRCFALTTIEIPNSVTEIAPGAFKNCMGLTTIEIPNSVAEIAPNVFYNCQSLATITIPDSIQSIGEQAFDGCTSLTSITIPNSVTSIGKRSFYNCTSLTTIEIPNSVISIAQGAFEDCKNLTSITIPFIGESKTSYSYFGYIFGATDYTAQSFYVPSSLTKVIISNECERIYGHAFNGCMYLTTITIPESVTDIGANAFYQCYRLIEVYNLSSIDIDGYVGSYAKVIHTSKDEHSNLYTINGDIYCITDDEKIFFEQGDKDCKEVTIDNSATSIGNCAFLDCTALTSITIPNNVTSIGDGAFLNCSSLTSITIPNNVTSIGDMAFIGCSSLTSITIPNSVTSIGYYPIFGCDRLKSIAYEGTKAQWNTLMKDPNWDSGLNSCTVHCTDGDIVVS